MNLPEFSVNKRVTVTMLTILTIIFGVITLSKMGLEMMPDMDYPVVSIVTIYPGASSEDIEETLTKPLESVLAGVKGIKSIKSQSSENQSVITVEFRWGTNLDFAAQDLRDAMDMISDQLPDDANRPMVMKMNMADMPVLVYGVVGKDTYKTRKFIEDDVEQQLKHLDGVASVMIMGGKEAEKQIVVDKTKLERNNISIDDIVNILKAQNLNIPASHVVKRQSDFLIRTVGEFQNIKEIQNTPIGMSNTGNLIYIKDVATALDGYKEQRFHLRTNKKESVMMMVSKESGANTLSVGKSVKDEIAKIMEKYPQKGIKFIEIMDQGHIVEMVTSSSSSNAIMGGLLAIIVMFLFLRNWRPTLAISLAIPISVIATFIPLYLAKYSLNMMTLGGLALGVGMLVDNAVVVLENTFRHREEGEDRRTAANKGASEVAMAITASTLTTISVFLPIVFVPGIAGMLFRDQSLTVTFSLACSLLVALTLVPLLSSRFLILRSERKKRSVWTDSLSDRLGRYIASLDDIYQKALNWALDHRKTVVISMAALFILSMAIVYPLRLVGTEFMPNIDQGQIYLSLETTPGTSLEVTESVIAKAERVIQEVAQDDLVNMHSNIGSGEGFAALFSGSGSHSATVSVNLVSPEKRDRSQEEIQQEIIDKLKTVPGLRLVGAEDPGAEMMGFGGKPVDIEIYGFDRGKATALANQIADMVRGIDGTTNVQTTIEKASPETQIIVDRAKAYSLGLNVGSIANTMNADVDGTIATLYREGGSEYNVRVRLQEKDRNTAEDVYRMSITSPAMAQVPLGNVATLKAAQGPVTIERKNRERLVEVTADLKGRDQGSVIRDIKARLKSIDLPEGFVVEMGGSAKNKAESFKWLGLALLGAVFLVYAVMASLFESLLDPFIIMFTFPLAMIGAVWMFFFTGTTFSIIAFVGVIMLAGIVVNNAIVMVDYINQLRKSGMELREAVVKGGRTRLRPILITALTTILAMVPLAMGIGSGAEMRYPMARAVVGGLSVSTIFTLVLVPVIYTIFESFSAKLKQRKATAKDAEQQVSDES